MPEVRESLQWVRSGADLFAKALAALDDDRLAEPSRVPGWTHADVVAHVTGRLQAYARAFGADAGEAAAGDLREQYAESAATLVGVFAERPNRGDWNDTITIDGTDELSGDALWPLARELMVRAVDLGDEVGFRDLPPEFLAALIGDITRHRASDGSPALEVLSQDTGEAWRIDGVGDPLRVMAPLADMAAWLASRQTSTIKVLGPGELPALPRWL